MKIIVLQVGMLATNCYIIYNENTNEGVVIDPGDDAKNILDAIEKYNLDVKTIFLTHGHHDHIGAVSELKEALKAKVFINENDNYLLNASTNDVNSCFDVESKDVSADEFYCDGDIIEKAGLKFEIKATPGHTSGGVCILCDKVVFCGDTIFAESIGRTDLAGGSYTKLIDSIKSKILPLDDDVMLLPGHGPTTTVGHERKYNPFLK